MGHSPATCAGGAGRRQASSSGSLRTCLRSSGASHTRRSERPILSSVTASPPPRRYDSDPTDPLWQLIEPLVGVVQPATAQDDVDDLAARVLSPGGQRWPAAATAARSVATAGQSDRSHTGAAEGKPSRSTRSAVLTVWCERRRWISDTFSETRSCLPGGGQLLQHRWQGNGPYSAVRR